MNQLLNPARNVTNRATPVTKGIVNTIASWCIDSLKGHTPEAVKCRGARMTIPVVSTCEHPTAQRQKFRITVGGLSFDLKFERSVSLRDLRVLRKLLNCGKLALTPDELKMAAALRSTIETAVQTNVDVAARLATLAL